MSSEKTKSQDEQFLKSKKLLPNHLIKLRVPITLTKLQEMFYQLNEKQSDLQLKNDELEIAKSDLALLVKQYTNLYNAIPVAYLTLSRSGLILQINLAGSHLLGVEQSLLINQNFQRFISTEYWPEYNSFLDKLYNNYSQEVFEFQLLRAEDSILVHFEAQVNKEQNSCIATLIDVTAEEQKRLLTKEDTRYRIIFESITHGVLLCSRDGKIISANQAAKTILGVGLNQIESRTLIEIFSNPIHENGKVFSQETLPFMNIISSNDSTQDVIMGYMSQSSTYYTWIVISVIAINIPDEDDVQFLINFDDITSQKNMVLYNTLTIREKQIFQMLIKGCSRKEIARNLEISPKTVDKHKENLMEKLKMYLPKELIDFSKQF